MEKPKNTIIVRWWDWTKRTRKHEVHNWHISRTKDGTSTVSRALYWILAIANLQWTAHQPIVVAQLLSHLSSVPPVQDSDPSLSLYPKNYVNCNLQKKLTNLKPKKTCNTTSKSVTNVYYGRMASEWMTKMSDDRGRKKMHSQMKTMITVRF